MTVIEILKVFIVSQLVKLGDKIVWDKFKTEFEEEAESKLGIEFDHNKRMQVNGFIDEFAANFEAKNGYSFIGTTMLAEVIEDSLGTGDACKLGDEQRKMLADLTPKAEEAPKEEKTEVAEEVPEEESKDEDGFFTRSKKSKKKKNKTA